MAVDFGGDSDYEGLKIFDPSTLPANPSPDLFYRHHVSLASAIGKVWSRREVIFALAERDVRASYKQAALGMAWAFISPVLQVILFTLIFSRVKAFNAPRVPYAIYAYVGIMCWTYFAGALSSGGNSMIGNLNLLQKTHFPRECFPLSQMLEQTLYTTIALLPLAILIGYNGFAPKIEVLWFPLFIAVETMFTTGVILAMAALIVYVRDFQQVMSIIMPLGLFATPVIWPLDKLRTSPSPPPSPRRPSADLLASSILSAPVIDSVRRTLPAGPQPRLDTPGHRHRQRQPLFRLRVSHLQAARGGICRHQLTARSSSSTLGSASGPTGPGPA